MPRARFRNQAAHESAGPSWPLCPQRRAWDHSIIERALLNPTVMHILTFCNHVWLYMRLDLSLSLSLHSLNAFSCMCIYLCDSMCLKCHERIQSRNHFWIFRAFPSFQCRHSWAQPRHAPRSWSKANPWGSERPESIRAKVRPVVALKFLQGGLPRGRMRQRVPRFQYPMNGTRPKKRVYLLNFLEIY